MKGRIIVIGATVLTLFSLLFSSPASATDDPPAEEVLVDILAAHGSGCPPGTVFVHMWPDNLTFTVVYSEYVARIGPGAPLLDFRKSCQLSVRVHVPDGYTYALYRTGHSGFGDLAEGATGTQRASYYFQGSPNTNTRTHAFAGPLNDHWYNTDESDLAVLEWHPCGELRNLNINTELRVNAGTSSPDKVSFMTMDSTDGDISTVYHLAWKECPES
jgi:hypothetical protein